MTDSDFLGEVFNIQRLYEEGVKTREECAEMFGEALEEATNES